MFYRLFALLTSVTFLMSCNSASTTSTAPTNVRELMESEGWMFCKTVGADCYYEYADDPWIFEDQATYDLFRRDHNSISEYAITRPNTDGISLRNYDKNDDHFKAQHWINYFVEKGNYNLRADHARRNSGRLGVISKHYTGKAINTGSGGVIYLNIPETTYTLKIEVQDNH